MFRPGSLHDPGCPSIACNAFVIRLTKPVAKLAVRLNFRQSGSVLAFNFHFRIGERSRGRLERVVHNLGNVLGTSFKFEGLAKSRNRTTSAFNRFTSEEM